MVPKQSQMDAGLELKLLRLIKVADVIATRVFPDLVEDVFFASIPS